MPDLIKIFVTPMGKWLLDLCITNLDPRFYGKIELTYEDGMLVHVKKGDSIVPPWIGSKRKE